MGNIPILFIVSQLLLLLLLAIAQVLAQGEIIPGYGWSAYLSSGNTIPFSLTWDAGSLVVVGYVVVPQPPSTIAFATRLQVDGVVSSYVQWQGSSSDWVFSGDYSITKRAAVVLTQQVTSSFSVRGFYMTNGTAERSVQKFGSGLSVRAMRFVPGTEELLVTGVQTRSNAGNDILFMNLNANGSIAVQTAFGSPLTDNGLFVLAINAREALVLSSVQGSFDAGNANLTAGSTNFALTRMNGATRVWTRIWGSNGLDSPKKLAYDSETGTIVVVGEVRQSVHGKPLVGDLDVLVTCFDAEGTRLWTQIFGMSGEDTVADVVIHPVTKAIYVVGATTGVAELNVVKSRDVFLSKLTPGDGTVLWTTTYGSSRDDYPVAMVLVPEFENTIFITGHTKGNFLGRSNPTGNFQGFVFTVPLDKPATSTVPTTQSARPTETASNGPRRDSELSLGELIAKYMVWVVVGSVVLGIMVIVALYCALRKSCNASNTIDERWGETPGRNFFGSPKVQNNGQFDVFSATTDSMANANVNPISFADDHTFPSSQARHDTRPSASRVPDERRNDSSENYGDHYMDRPTNSAYNRDDQGFDGDVRRRSPRVHKQNDMDRAATNQHIPTIPTVPTIPSQSRHAAQSNHQLNSSPSRQAGGFGLTNSQSRYAVPNGGNGFPSRQLPVPNDPSFELPIYGKPASSSGSSGFEPPVLSNPAFAAYDETGSDAPAEQPAFRQPTTPLFSVSKNPFPSSTPRLVVQVGPPPSVYNRSAPMRQVPNTNNLPQQLPQHSAPVPSFSGALSRTRPPAQAATAPARRSPDQDRNAPRLPMQQARPQSHFDDGQPWQPPEGLNRTITMPHTGSPIPDEEHTTRVPHGSTAPRRPPSNEWAI